MAIKYHRSRIYASLLIALLIGCQSNVNLPKKPPDKVAEEEQVVRAHTAATVHNKPTTQEKEIVREREQADDVSPISLQDSTATAMPTDAARSLTQDGINGDTEIILELEMTSSMLMQQSFGSDDEDVPHAYAALHESGEGDEGRLEQLERDFTHEMNAVLAQNFMHDVNTLSEQLSD